MNLELVNAFINALLSKDLYFNSYWGISMDSVHFPPIEAARGRAYGLKSSRKWDDYSEFQEAILIVAQIENSPLYQALS